MKTKIIPFDLETAKKIQAGEIEGRIVTESGIPIRIICFDRISEHYKPIVAMVKYQYNEEIYTYSKNGEYDWGANPQFNLTIELPEETQEEQHPIEESELYQAGYKVGFEAGRCVAFDEKKEHAIKKETPKHEFKPFDKVLVRDNDYQVWTANLYSHTMYDSACPYGVFCGCYYKQCIPYEGNEHLVGTTDNPKED